jgi:hypothetical protein
MYDGEATSVISVAHEASLSTSSSSSSRAMLFWGCRSGALVAALRDEVVAYPGEVLVGARLDVSRILWREVMSVDETWKVAICVSGPKGMADDVRRTVCEIARMRRKGVITFVDECFGW